jgi:hypothetical protein
MEAAGGPVLVDGGKGPRDGRGGADLVIDVARKDCASGHFIGEGHAEGIAVFRKRPAVFAGP